MNVVERAAGRGIEQAMLDRLVDGELDEGRRSALLRELDREPGGWKRCAAAFLEAQAWRAAVGVGGGVVGTEARGRPGLARGVSFGRMSCAAAAVVVAFGVGFVARGPAATDGNRAAGGMLAHRPDPAGGRHDGKMVASPVEPPATAIPDSLRRQMERQGYRVDGNRKMVPVALEDGRKVAVPVETVSLRYVGRPIH